MIMGIVKGAFFSSSPSFSIFTFYFLFFSLIVTKGKEEEIANSNITKFKINTGEGGGGSGHSGGGGSGEEMKEVKRRWRRGMRRLRRWRRLRCVRINKRRVLCSDEWGGEAGR